MVIDEEKLDEILEKLYEESHEWDLDDQEKVDAFLEEEFAKYHDKKFDWRLKLLQDLDPFAETDPYKVLAEDKETQYSSVFSNDFILDVENKKKYYESKLENSLRYPPNFRHYENYNSYSYLNRDASV